jgi:hypothetical protein
LKIGADLALAFFAEYGIVAKRDSTEPGALRSLRQNRDGSIGTTTPSRTLWHKTADQILDSLAAYCQRINDSGH